MMKATKGEKILFIILCVLIIVVCYFKFLINPLNKKLDTLENKKNDYENKVNLLNAAIASKNNQQLQVKTLKYKISEITESYFPQFDEEKVIAIFDDFIKNSKLSVKVINFTEPKDDINVDKDDRNKDNNKIKQSLGQIINEYNKLLKIKDDENNESNDDSKGTNEQINKSKNDNIQKMQVTVSFSGTYDNLMKFIDEIENFDKKIVINNISIAAAKNVSGSMMFDLYSVPQFKESEYYKWNVNVPFGKKNPFQDTLETLASNRISSKSSEIKYDFYMTMLPVTSDLPAIIIQKSELKDATNFACGDKNDVDNAEIYIEKKNDKYYYKYKTSEQSYPKDYKNTLMFKPYGNSINVKIYSASRNSDEDKSGVNLKIINKADLDVCIYILDDDSTRPRVNIIKEGSVNVK